ncbi:mitochondrial carrier domain-containing protein [Panaeolus papilionaceus]|nr:mitochondrial carrier domain-containing protein [Panaeolus papilionaceus]
MTSIWSRVFPTIHADSPETQEGARSTLKAAALQTVRTAVAVPENELKRWRRTFDNNSKEVNGEKFLDPESFVNAVAPSGDLVKIGREQYAILFRIADTTRRGLVSWEDFTVFQTLLKRPDADYWMAFQYFDVDHSGYIDYNEFKSVFSANLGPDAIPFDFDCDWVKLYLGTKNGQHVLGYNEFTQLMKGLQGERLRQAFQYLDKDQDGFIRPDEFKRIILEIAGHKLSEAVIDRLPTLCTLSPGQRISYSEVVAFYNVIREMDMVERIIREATAKSKDGRIDQTDFLNYAASNSRYSLFTPMEANIIFHFAGRGVATQRLALIDFAQLLDPRWRPPHEALREKPPVKTSVLNNIAHSAYNFGLGGIAGAVGATIVYPIDMVKVCFLFPDRLQMQNQRSTVVGQLLYKNSIDCAKKILRNEGFLGFYRGLGPQLVGVAPEKAIKLTVNDLIRGRAMDPETGRIKVFWELIAGGAAGGCQVVFTNPLEIVKIRLQVQGEAAKVEGAVPKGAIHIIRQLGILGLYKGSSACLLRDIPFSAIYFTAYSHLKSDVFQEGYNGKKLSFLETLAAAGIAGMPAAYLTTPADVVKTRLQVEAKKGQTNYTGLRDAFVKIYREEGFKALFKGGPARVIRSSPQFGFTLLAYETLKTSFPFPWAEKTPQMETVLSTSRPDELSKIRARNALKILLDVHGDFGARAASMGSKPLSLANPRLSSS